MFLLAIVAASSLAIASTSASHHYNTDNSRIDNCEDFSYEADGDTFRDVSYPLIHEAFSCDYVDHPFVAYIEDAPQFRNCVHLDLDEGFQESNIRQFRVQYNGDLSRSTLEETYDSVYKAVTDECDRKNVIISLYSFAPLPQAELRNELKPEDIVIDYFYDPRAAYSPTHQGAYITVFRKKDVDLPTSYAHLLSTNEKGEIPAQISANDRPRLTVSGSKGQCLFTTTGDGTIVPCLGG